MENRAPSLILRIAGRHSTVKGHEDGISQEKALRRWRLVSLETRERCASGSIIDCRACGFNGETPLVTRLGNWSLMVQSASQKDIGVQQRVRSAGKESLGLEGCLGKPIAERNINLAGRKSWYSAQPRFQIARELTTNSCP